MALGDGLSDLMKQAQQMQERVQKLQEEAAKTEVTGESGAGLVKITMTGRHDVRKVDIDSNLLNEAKDVLEDLIAAATNDAVRRVEKNQQEIVFKLLFFCWDMHIGLKFFLMEHSFYSITCIFLILITPCYVGYVWFINTYFKIKVA